MLSLFLPLSHTYTGTVFSVYNIFLQSSTHVAIQVSSSFTHNVHVHEGLNNRSLFLSITFTPSVLSPCMAILLLMYIQSTAVRFMHTLSLSNTQTVLSIYIFMYSYHFCITIPSIKLLWHCYYHDYGGKSSPIWRNVTPFSPPAILSDSDKCFVLC